jgi:hypothetical protein
VGIGTLMGTCNPNGHGFGHKMKPVMGHGGFLVGRFYVCEHRFGWAKSSRFVPIAISTTDHSVMPISM